MPQQQSVLEHLSNKSSRVGYKTMTEAADSVLSTTSRVMIGRRRLRQTWSLATATTIALSMSVACSFQPLPVSISPTQYLPPLFTTDETGALRQGRGARTQRHVAASSDALLFELTKQVPRDSTSFEQSRDRSRLMKDATDSSISTRHIYQSKNDKKTVQFKTITESARKKQLTLANQSKRYSRSSTMPGFKHTTDNQRAYNEGIRLAERSSGKKLVDSPAAKVKRRQVNGETMYKSSPSVPDSMVQFANELHQVDRITRNEEIELGEKTQEAIRLQNLYEVLEVKLDREPSDEEWCAAAGKINMEAVRQALDEGLEAKNKLVTSNLRMVQSVVNTYIRNGLSGKYNAGDMMQEGIVALIRAAEKFEPDRGWKFSTYAMYWVRASVKRSHVHQSRIVVVPQRLHEKRKQLIRVEQEMATELGRKPTKKELGDAVNMSELQVDRCIEAMAQRCFSLDQEVTNANKPMSTDSKSSLIEIIQSKTDDGEHHSLSQKHLREDLIETLQRHLSDDEVNVLLLRFGLKGQQKLNGQQLTIAEVAKVVGLSSDKVRRVIKKSLERLQTVGADEWLEFQRELL